MKKVSPGNLEAFQVRRRRSLRDNSRSRSERLEMCVVQERRSALHLLFLEVKTIDLVTNFLVTGAEFSGLPETGLRTL